MLHADLLVRGHRGAGGVTPAFVGRCGGFYYGMGTEKQEKRPGDNFRAGAFHPSFCWKRPADSSLPYNSPFVRQYVMVSNKFCAGWPYLVRRQSVGYVSFIQSPKEQPFMADETDEGGRADKSD